MREGVEMEGPTQSQSTSREQVVRIDWNLKLAFTPGSTRLMN